MTGDGSIKATVLLSENFRVTCEGRRTRSTDTPGRRKRKIPKRCIPGPPNFPLDSCSVFPFSLFFNVYLGLFFVYNFLPFVHV